METLRNRLDRPLRPPGRNRADNHYIWTEVYDVTAGKKKGTCRTGSFKSCAFSIPEGHKVRINVYRMNSKDVEFLDEVHTKSGKLPTA
ncbi:hypothetical protein AB0I52_31265 [Streptomyces sp. NPDC050423]|uniref:hypothetical protein n=1 Tax=Streptomyces sp. NPDC050423 TaxID=3155402 RepID=UPI003435BB19